MDKKYDHQSTEKRLQHKWEEKKTYSPANNTGPSFTIDTPPPTVSGSLHIGHVFSYTQTDISARYKRMSGYSVFYPFGFDDNGLPTERYVEKKCDVRPADLGRSKFIELCLEQTKEAELSFKALWQNIGLSVDWNYWYSTISADSRRLSQMSFIKLYKDGYIYRKDEPSLYCTTCRTTVAQAELDDLEVASFFNDIVFKDDQGNDLIIGTTRPELLYSVGALLYHPSDSRYQHLKGRKARSPIFNREIPIYEDELVDPAKGTGLVMVCTFGDQTDILWYKKHKLPLILSMGLDGRWLPETGILAGLKVAEARKTIIEALKEQGLLVNQKPITHAVNVHDRCKKEIEYNVLTQWFVKILEHKDAFLKMADEITWHPTFMKSRYVNWVNNVKWDWCISRQRLFGIPFPAWHCTSCKKVLLPELKDLPVDPQEMAYPGGTCPHCKSSAITPDTDVMDTWNTSSITPYITHQLLAPSADPFVNSDKYLPMGMRPQAHDIIRTWAFYTIIKAWMHNKTIPWKEITISGHVLSSEKEKISKSKGNNPLAPENLLAQYSADAIRYWTASGSLGHDISFSDAKLKNGQRLTTKLWNAFIFAQPHIGEVDPTKRPTQLGIVNEWILDAASELFIQYNHAFKTHEFGQALERLEQFFWADFCDNYLELIKNQLFNPQEYDADTVYATRWTLYQVGLRILQLYAPYVPFVTEAIYESLYAGKVGVESLHQTRFKEIQTQQSFADARHTMGLINEIVAQVRKLKTSQQLSLKTALVKLMIHATAEQRAKIAGHEQLVKGVTQAGTIEYSTQTDSEAQLLGDENQRWAVVVLPEK